jgi:23S rRNA (cytosine1962-C5)-methyltransferase
MEVLERLVHFEDEHLLVVNKPPGWNTHSPGPWAGEGVYEWLRNREPRWAGLALVHRLDKETSGLLVFGKTALANRSLTLQFSQQTVRKRYLLVTDRPINEHRLAVKSSLVRVGPRYFSRPPHAGGAVAETHFRLLRCGPEGTLLEAEPLTGRTHQVRVHAAQLGLPIVGDTLYGGTPAGRLHLHAAELVLRHPASDQRMAFHVPADFSAHPGLARRLAVIDPALTNCYRLIHGAADGWPGWYVDRLGDFLLSRAGRALGMGEREHLQRWLNDLDLRGAYHRRLSRNLRCGSPAEIRSQALLGERAEGAFVVRENGMVFELRFEEGYSVGLFLDQRDNRRRVLVNHVAAGFPLAVAGMVGARVLNTFAYTCGFSVCAAKAGASVTSLDLSRKHLEWGKRNFALNRLDLANHDFIHGDVFEWLRRFRKKGRQFEVILIDPPTFSTSKERGPFRVVCDYGDLVQAALPLLAPRGVMFASCNAVKVSPEKLLGIISTAISSSGRAIQQIHFAPQPPDFPITPNERYSLKTVWVRC